MSSTHNIVSVLRSRVARNVYLWALNISLTFYLNAQNSLVYNYNFDSPWYYRVQIITIMLLASLTYLNNLVLVPRLLVKKKRLAYYSSIGTAIIITSLLHVLLLKEGTKHFDVDHMQQVGIMSTTVSSSFSFGDIANDMVAYILGHSVWIFLFTAAWYMNDYGKQQKIAEAAQRKQVEMELHFLKDQINPHFLFNTLNNLYGLALKKTDNAPDAILKLSSILRYLLYESNTGLVSVEKEKEIMQAYIELELLRITDTSGLKFSVNADGNYSIPPLLWLPVLENLFKHGTRTLADKYIADFNFSIREGSMRITSSNEYRGAATNGNGHSKAGGIGLENLRKRLAILYPGKHAIHQHKDDTTYTIDVQIALT
jgi:two-component system, LytTR family, sensor kinase